MDLTVDHAAYCINTARLLRMVLTWQSTPLTLNVCAEHDSCHDEWKPRFWRERQDSTPRTPAGDGRGRATV